MIIEFQGKDHIFADDTPEDAIHEYFSGNAAPQQQPSQNGGIFGALGQAAQGVLQGRGQAYDTTPNPLSSGSFLTPEIVQTEMAGRQRVQENTVAQRIEQRQQQERSLEAEKDRKQQFKLRQQEFQNRKAEFDTNLKIEQEIAKAKADQKTTDAEGKIKADKEMADYKAEIAKKKEEFLTQERIKLQAAKGVTVPDGSMYLPPGGGEAITNPRDYAPQKPAAPVKWEKYSSEDGFMHRFNPVTGEDHVVLNQDTDEPVKAVRKAAAASRPMTTMDAAKFIGAATKHFEDLGEEATDEQVFAYALQLKRQAESIAGGKQAPTVITAPDGTQVEIVD